MNRNLFWRLLALLAVLLTSGEYAKALPPGIDHIYLVDFSSDTSNGAPIEKNEEFFPKLFLTSPGVFEGDVTFENYYSYPHYFRFYSLLQDNFNYDWNINNISPQSEESYLSQVGKSGIYKAYDVCDKTVVPTGFDGGPTWALSQSGSYHITVDINKGTLELRPIDNIFVILGDPEAPSEEEYADQCSINNFHEYIEPGDVSLNFYSPSKESWMKPNLKENGLREGVNYIAGFEPCSSPVPFKIEGWPGGIISTGRGGITLTTDDIFKGNISAESLFYVGDANNWLVSDYRYQCSKLDDSGKRFDVLIPEGTWDFKIIGPKNWQDFITLGSGGSVWKNEKGEYVMQLRNSSDSHNISFDYSSFSDCHGILDLDELTLTLPAEAAPLSERGKNDEVPDFSERMYVVFPSLNEMELYKGASPLVHNLYNYLEKIDENTWTGQIYLNGDFNFVFELTPKGQPNVCIGPSSGKDVSLVCNDGYAYASGSLSESPFCWSPSEIAGKYAVVTVTKEGDSFKVAVDCKEAVKLDYNIYLIGAPQGWYITEGNMPLRKTDNGGYYGEFNIPKGDAMLRFYTQLGNWDTNSIGAHYDDYPMEFEMADGSLQTECVNGKGSWSFPDWPGGKMYIYVDLNAMKVDFSDRPIEHAGNILTERTRQPYEDGVFATDSDHDVAKPLTETSPGVYRYTSYVQELNSGMLRFFSRRLPISPEEPEWIGSYTISLEGDGFIDFKEKHFAEFDIVLNNEIGTKAATPLRWEIRNPHDFTLLDIVVDLNKKKLYVADFGYRVLVPAGEPAPDAKTAPQSADRIIWNSSGDIVDIPEGEFDVWLFDGTNKEPSEKKTVSFKDDSYQIWCPQGTYWWYPGALTVPDWHGGKVFIDSYSVFDLSSLESIKVTSFNGDGYDTGILSQTAPASMVFKGSVQLTGSEKAGYNFIRDLGILLAEKTVMAGEPGQEYEHYTNVHIGCPYPNQMYLPSPTNEERSLYLLKSRTVTSDIGWGSSGFLLPNLSDEAKLDITLDLNNMTIEAGVVEGFTSLTYEVVAGADSKLDGLKSYVSADGNMIVETEPFHDYDVGNSEYNFNFLTDHGSIIVPAGSESLTIDFDERGLWTGSFTEIPATVPADAPSRRLAARNAALESATWNFEMPKDDSFYIQMLIDEKKKLLTVFSMTHNNCFLIEKGQKHATIADLLSGQAELLAPSAETGVWKGSFDLIDGEVPDFISFRHSISGYWWPFYGISHTGGYWHDGNDILDFSSEGDSASQSAVDKFKRNMEGDMIRFLATDWKLIEAKPGNYEAVYDSNEGLLTITRKGDTPGMIVSPESVASTLRIIPGSGEVTVIASEPTRIDIYSVSGMLVRSLEVADGTTVVRIPSGLYIINGKKIGVK